MLRHADIGTVPPWTSTRTPLIKDKLAAQNQVMEAMRKLRMVKLPPEDNINSREQQFKLCTGELADSLSQKIPVYRDDLRDVGHRILG
jgi:hypothetical protein